MSIIVPMSGIRTRYRAILGEACFEGQYVAGWHLPLIAGIKALHAADQTRRL
jgi:hypothetical protein